MSQITTVEPQIDSFARFQSLQAGQYWTSQVAIPDEGIDAGETLLLKSIRWVDDAPHTIILRAHPGKIGGWYKKYRNPDDHSAGYSTTKYDEHKFLLPDFLAKFQFEPEHARIRQQELQQVQGKLLELQSELAQSQTDPSVMAKVIESGMLALEADHSKHINTGTGAVGDDSTAQASTQVAPMPRGDELAVIATGSVADALSTGVSSGMIADLKQAANRELQIATIKAEWMQEKTKSIGETIQAMTPFYEEQGAAALAQTEDTRSYIAKVLKGIESLDLYVGKDVRIMPIREGASAPRDVPLTFVQRKLIMDEELAVWLDIGYWFDFRSVARFYDALREHNGLVDQIFPTKRCVLVMATTRRSINYKDVYTNAAFNEANKAVFLLVRDGDNVYRVDSPVESHLGAERLFPTKDDQDRVFRGVDGSTVKFEDVAYTDRLAAHEHYALHYKRFMLLACGLDHNHNLFGDFYDGPKSFQFVSMAFQDKHCHFLHDDDASRLLEVAKRLSVEDWIEEKNNYIRSGSRVLCHWPNLMTPSTAPGACKEYGSHNGFDRLYVPANDYGVGIVYRDGNESFVDVEVSRNKRKFNAKVNLSAYEETRWSHADDSGMAYLCLDAVEPGDLAWYIHHRGSRINHLGYIRFFKHALQFVESERAVEAGSRRRLLEALEDGNIAAGPEAEAIVNRAVMAWRAANRGDPLPLFGVDDAKTQWTSLLDQMYMLAGEGARRVDEVADFVRELGYAPLRLILSGNAKLVVYAVPLASERDDRLEPHAWVHAITIAKGKTRYTEKARRWASMPKLAASETTIHEWEGVDAWAGKATVFQSFDHKQQLFNASNGCRKLLEPFGTTMDLNTWAYWYDEWARVRNAYIERKKKMGDPHMHVIVGVALSAKERCARPLCVSVFDFHALLHRLAPNDDCRQLVEAEYKRRFADKNHARNKFATDLNREHDWSVRIVAKPENGTLSFSDGGNDAASMHHADPRLTTRYAAWRSEYRTSFTFWVNDEARGETDDTLAIDDALGIELPTNFDPVTCIYFRRYETRKLGEDPQPLPPYSIWYDILVDKDLIERFKEGQNSARGAAELKSMLYKSDRDGDDNTGYQSSNRDVSSLAAARTWIGNHWKAGCVEASTMPDAPQPPAGVERWYLMA